jgi:hypothetical protein
MSVFTLSAPKGGVRPFVIVSAALCLMGTSSFAQQTLFKLLPPEQTSVTFKNDLVEDEHLNVLSYEYLYNGGGVAVGDINNDGLEDLFFTSNLGKISFILTSVI